MYIHPCIYIHVCTFDSVYAILCVRECIHVYTSMYTHSCIYIHVYTSTCMYV